ncbi:MAG: SdrD B-like domain-containing protein [Actinomycetaceae bacterium]|nr:SdrD B-like domain-containing protein [Actinomycetaceae bacterium]
MVNRVGRARGKTAAVFGAVVSLVAVGSLSTLPVFAAGQEVTITQTTNPVVQSITLTVLDGTPGWDDLDNDARNQKIRSNDAIDMNVKIAKAIGTMDNWAIDVLLPQGVQFDAIPTLCLTGSTLTPATMPKAENPLAADSYTRLPRQHLHCKRGNIGGNSTGDFGVDLEGAKVRAELPNGHKIEDMDITVTWDQGGERVKVNSNPPQPITVTSAPRWQVDVWGGNNSSTAGYARLKCPWGEGKWCYRLDGDLTVKADNGGKGTEPLTSPMTMNLDLSPAALFPGTAKNSGGKTLVDELQTAQAAVAAGNATDAQKDFLKQYAPRFYQGPGDAPTAGTDYQKKYYQVPNYGTDNAGAWVFGSTTDGNRPVQSNVVDSGVIKTDGNVAGTPGQEDTSIPRLGKIPIIIEGADTTLASFPTYNGTINNGSYPNMADSAYAVVGGFTMFLPEDTVKEFGTSGSTSTSLRVTYEVTDFQAQSISNVPNIPETQQQQECLSELAELHPNVPLLTMFNYRTRAPYLANRTKIEKCHYLLENNKKVANITIAKPTLGGVLKDFIGLPGDPKNGTGSSTQFYLPGYSPNVSEKTALQGQYVTTRISSNLTTGADSASGVLMYCDVWDGSYLDLADIKVANFDNSYYGFNRLGSAVQKNSDATVKATNPGVWISGTTSTNAFDLNTSDRSAKGTHDALRAVGYFTDASKVDDAIINSDAFEVWYAHIDDVDSKKYPAGTTSVGPVQDTAREYFPSMIKPVGTNPLPSQNHQRQRCMDAVWENTPGAANKPSSTAAAQPAKIAEDGTEYYEHVNAVMIYMRVPRTEVYNGAPAITLGFRVADDAPDGKVIPNFLNFSAGFAGELETVKTPTVPANNPFIPKATYLNYLKTETRTTTTAKGPEIPGLTLSGFQGYYPSNSSLPGADWDRFETITDHRPVNNSGYLMDQFTVGTFTGKLTSSVTKYLIPYNDSGTFGARLSPTSPTANTAGGRRFQVELQPIVRVPITAATPETVPLVVEDCMEPGFDYDSMVAGSSAPVYMGTRPANDPKAQLYCPSGSVYMRWELDVPPNQAQPLMYNVRVSSTVPSSIANGGPYFNIAGSRTKNETLPGTQDDLDKMFTSTDRTRVSKIGINIRQATSLTLGKTVLNPIVEANKSSKGTATLNIPGADGNPSSSREIQYNVTVANLQESKTDGSNNVRDPYVIDILPTKADGETSIANQAYLSSLSIPNGLAFNNGRTASLFVTNKTGLAFVEETAPGATLGALKDEITNVTWCSFTGSTEIGTPKVFTNGAIPAPEAKMVQNGKMFTEDGIDNNNCPTTTADVTAVMARYNGTLNTSESFMVTLGMIPFNNDGAHNTYTNLVGGTSVVTTTTETGAQLAPVRTPVDVNFMTLGDLIFKDLNADGRKDNNEPGLGGVTVKLCGTDSTGQVYSDDSPRPVGAKPCPFGTTSTSGIYTFDKLVSGQYTVHFAIPDVYGVSPKGRGAAAGVTYDSDGSVVAAPQAGAAPTGTRWVSTDAFTLSPGKSRTDIDQGVTTAAIGDYIWQDTNSNGIQDDDEQPIQGARVELLTADGSPVPNQTARTTGRDGLYNFSGLESGQYKIRITPPSGKSWAATLKDDDWAKLKTSKGDKTATGAEIAVLVDPGKTISNADQGFVPTFQIGNQVWVDANKDGIQSNAEIAARGVPGMKVTLSGTTAAGTDIGTWQNTYGPEVCTAPDCVVVAGTPGTPGTPGSITVPVGGDGTYKLPKVPNGTYSLKFVMDDGATDQWNWTKPAQGGNGAQDSDVVATQEGPQTKLEGTVSNIAVTNADRLDIDAGLFRGELKLSITKETTLGSIPLPEVGKSVSVPWTFTVTNDPESSANAVNVGVKDTPLGLDAVTPGRPQCKDTTLCTITAGRVNLKPGGSVTFIANQDVSRAQAEARLASATDGGYLVNTARAIADNCPADGTTTCTTEAVTAKVPITSVEAVKSADPKYFGDADQDIVYNIVVTNKGKEPVIPAVHDGKIGNLSAKDSSGNAVANDAVLNGGDFRTYTGTYKSTKNDVALEKITNIADVTATPVTCGEDGANKVCQPLHVKSNEFSIPLAAIKLEMTPIDCAFTEDPANPGKATDIRYKLKVTRTGPYRGELRGKVKSSVVADTSYVEFVLPPGTSNSTELMKNPRTGEIVPHAERWGADPAKTDDLLKDYITGNSWTEDVQGVEGTTILKLASAITDVVEVPRASITTVVIPVKQNLTGAETSTGTYFTITNTGLAPVKVGTITAGVDGNKDLQELYDDDDAKGRTPVVCTAANNCKTYGDVQALILQPGEQVLMGGPHIVRNPANNEDVADIIKRTVTTNAVTVCDTNALKCTTQKPVKATTVTELGTAAMTLQKTAKTSTYQQAGQKIKYEFLLVNSGSVDLVNPSISDDKITGTIDKDKVKAGQCAATRDDTDVPAECYREGTGLNEKLIVEPGGSVTFEAEYTVTDGDIATDTLSVKNTATATSTCKLITPATGDCTPPSAVTAEAIVPKTAYKFTKTASHYILRDPKLTDHKDVTFVFAVTNTGATPLKTVTITDSMLPNNGGAVGTHDLSANPIAPGQTRFFTQVFDYTAGTWWDTTLAKPTAADRFLKNTAKMTALPAVPDGSLPTGYAAKEETSSVEIPLTAVGITKTPMADYFTKAGDKVPYLFTVINTGGDEVLDVSVSDPALSNTGQKACYVGAGKPTPAEIQTLMNGDSCTGDTVTEKLQAANTPDMAPATIYFVGWRKIVETDLAGFSSDPFYTPVPPSATDVSGGLEAGKVKNQAQVHAHVNGARIPDGAGTGGGFQPIKLDKTSNMTSTSLAKLSVVKTAAEKSFRVGDTIHYEFRVTNEGQAEITDVQIKDPTILGASATLKTASTCVAPSCTAGSSGEGPTLKPGGTATFQSSYAIQDADVTAKHVINTATATGKPSSANALAVNPVETVKADSNTVTTPLMRAKESLYVNAGSTTTAGDPLTYRLVTENTGESPIKVTTGGTITITIEFLDGSTCAVDKVLTAPADVIVPGETAFGVSSLTVTPQELLRDCAGKTYEQIGNISAVVKTPSTVTTGTEGETPKPLPALDPAMPGGSAAKAVEVPRAALVLTKSSKVLFFDDTTTELTWNFVLTNTGNTTITKPEIIDNMLKARANTTIKRCTTSACTDFHPDDQFEPDILAAGGKEYFQATSPIDKTKDLGAIENRASADMEGTGAKTKDDPGHAESYNGVKFNEQTVNKPVAEASARVARVGLEVTKDVTPGRYSKVGDLLEYTITVRNTGESAIQNVALSDVVFPTTGGSAGRDVSGIFHPDEGSCGTGCVLEKDANGKVTNVILLARGDITYKGTYVVTAADMQGTNPLVNEAKASGVVCTEITGTDENTRCTGTPGLTTTSNTAMATAERYGISLTKATSLTKAKVDDTITYTFVVTNTGIIPITHVAIEDDNIGDETIVFVGRSDKQPANGAAIDTIEPSTLNPLPAGANASYRVSRKVTETDKTEGSTVNLFAPGEDLALTPRWVKNMASVIGEVAAAQQDNENNLDTLFPAPPGPILGAPPVERIGSISNLVKTEVVDQITPPGGGEAPVPITPGGGTPVPDPDKPAPDKPVEPEKPGPTEPVTPVPGGDPDKPWKPGDPAPGGWKPGGNTTPDSPTTPEKWLKPDQTRIGYPINVNGPAVGLVKFSGSDPVAGDFNKGGGHRLRANGQSMTEPVNAAAAVWNAGTQTLHNLVIKDQVLSGPGVTGMRATLPDGSVMNFGADGTLVLPPEFHLLPGQVIRIDATLPSFSIHEYHKNVMAVEGKPVVGGVSVHANDAWIASGGQMHDALAATGANTVEMLRTSLVLFALGIILMGVTVLARKRQN